MTQQLFGTITLAVGNTGELMTAAVHIVISPTDCVIEVCNGNGEKPTRLSFTERPEAVRAMNDVVDLLEEHAFRMFV